MPSRTSTLTQSSPADGKTARFPFVPHPDFDRIPEPEICMLPAGSSIFDEDATESQHSAAPRLSPEGERFLFRKMNYFRWRANQLADERGAEDAEVQALLQDADDLRNRIAESNLGLVRAIAAKFSLSGSDFEELQSAGFEILLKAIRLFDCSRGFRFSTYATHAVQRHYYRFVKRQQKRSSMETGVETGMLQAMPAEETDEMIVAWIRNEERLSLLISRMAEHLDEREDRIVRDRFGLNADGVVKSLRQLGDELGLSKERARQLQISAINKLRSLFHELGPQLSDGLI